MIHDDLTIKNNNNPSAFKSVTTAPKIGTSSPIPDRMLIYDHSNPLLTHHSDQLLTHHSNQLLTHSLTLTLAEWWFVYDHSNPLLTCHSNQLLTQSHSLKIPEKMESPRRSLRSLWGLINLYHTYVSVKQDLYWSLSETECALWMITQLSVDHGPWTKTM